jgi:hypothetical protein
MRRHAQMLVCRESIRKVNRSRKSNSSQEFRNLDGKVKHAKVNAMVTQSLSRHHRSGTARHIAGTPRDKVRGVENFAYRIPTPRDQNQMLVGGI